MGGIRVFPLYGLLKHRPPIGSRKVRLGWLILVTAVVVAAVGAYLGANSGTSAALVVGDFSVLLAALVAAASCGRAGLSRGKNSRAWAFMALAAFVWAVGMGIWTFYGLTRDHNYPFPSLADAWFLAYCLPAAVALFSFTRPGGSRVALLRTVMDAAVISCAVLIVSWYTVLGPVFGSESDDLLARLTGLAYPVVDVIMTSLVLVLAMRRQPGERLPWLCFGGGLLLLTVTDSIYVRLTFEGVTGVTGSPLAVGWIAAFLLIALAPLTPQIESTGPDRQGYALALELLPYLPILGAVVLFAAPQVHELGTFLLVLGIAMLVLVLVRQVLIIFENITLTSGLEREVAARTAELEGLGAIVNSSADAIVGKTPEGVITSWNPGAELQYGYTAAEVIGRDIAFLIPPDRRGAEAGVLASIRAGGEARSYETERLRKDGASVPVSLTISPIRDGKSVRGIASIAQDITERRAAEMELRAAREAALESSRLKSEFLATMSHEIRTPMNGVVGLTALLLETPLDDTQRQYAQGVKGAGEALLALINDILDFSKLEAGKVDLDVRPFDPRLLVEEVAGLLAEPAHAKGLELIAYCAPEVPERLTGDAGRLRQILLNLAYNAVKFTATGEVAIRVKAAGQDAGRAMVRFEVRDTGIGIDSADHARLFESFSQADASTTRRYGGTGLGLAICSRLTEAMGGEIGVESTPGAGSTFWFSIPLPLAEHSPTSVPAPDFLTGLRVLVVDDNATNRLVLESQLRGWRLQPEAVPDARTALARAKEAAAAGQAFDIAVLDLCMPDVDGLQLARAITAADDLGSPRLIMLTSTMQFDGAELAAGGVREWLMKPVRSSEFYDRLVRLMAGREPATPAAPAPTQPLTHTLPSLGRILVVEDNEVNQLVARATVTKLGYEVDVVTDGAEAVSATAATDYAAVLMDCHMPVMDGFEATRIIRRRAGDAGRVPIVAMTAGALDGDRERCLAAGMDDYLAKPVDAGELAAALARWVPQKASANARPPSVDPGRLAILRELGPADGRGLLPAAAQAFRRDLPTRLAALRHAVDDGGGPDLEQAAHALKGAAANIGATAAAELCQQLERMGSNRDHHGGRDLVNRLEKELALVEAALDDALAVTP
jgi:two-component system, sensor histidine kinase and response regulator